MLEMRAERVQGGARTIYVLRASPTGSTVPKLHHTTFATGTGLRGAALADLNADGKLDLVTANATTSTINVLLNRSNAACTTGP